MDRTLIRSRSALEAIRVPLSPTPVGAVSSMELREFCQQLHQTVSTVIFPRVFITDRTSDYSDTIVETSDRIAAFIGRRNLSPVHPITRLLHEIACTLDHIGPNVEETDVATGWYVKHLCEQVVQVSSRQVALDITYADIHGIHAQTNPGPIDAAVHNAAVAASNLQAFLLVDTAAAITAIQSDLDDGISAQVVPVVHEPAARAVQAHLDLLRVSRAAVYAGAAASADVSRHRVRMRMDVPDATMTVADAEDDDHVVPDVIR